MPGRFLSVVALVALFALALLPAPARTTATEAAAAHYVNRNAQSDGDHEVHRAGCSHPPAQKNRLHLGYFTTCEAALGEARKHYAQVDGCYYCARACDTG